MRFEACLALLLISTLSAQAQQPKVLRAEITQFGIYEVGKVTRQSQSGILAGGTNTVNYKFKTERPVCRRGSGFILDSSIG